MVSVIVPYTPLTPSRERAWIYTQKKIHQILPDCELIVADISGNIRTYNKAQAIIDATKKVTHEVVVVHDADCWCKALPAAIQAIETNQCMVAIPHKAINNLNEVSTHCLYNNLPCTHKYKTRGITKCGLIVVMHRDVLQEFPPDIRFVGWGHEDHAWSYMIGSKYEFWLGNGVAWHLWHDRANKEVVNANNSQLLQAYKKMYGP
jgi:hypothetical protein